MEPDLSQDYSLPRHVQPGMKHFLAVLSLLLVSACHSPPVTVSDEITRQFQASGRTFVNLAEVLPVPWDRVCVLGPYSDNPAAKKNAGVPVGGGSHLVHRK